MADPSDLIVRLAMGATGLPEECRARHAAFLARMQHDDGGFPGRRGSSDLYYTSFALRGLAMLGELNEEIAVRAGGYLAKQWSEIAYSVQDAISSNVMKTTTPPNPFLSVSEFPPMSAVDFVSVVMSTVLIELATGREVPTRSSFDRRQAVIAFLERFRRKDGGYAKSFRGASSTYQTFLAVLCKQLIGVPLDGAEETVELVRSRQREDGGFVEMSSIRASGANPTAAAIGLLRALDALDAPTAKAATRFLAGMQTAEGGLRAHARIPVADLLSTFTGLATLDDLNSTDALDSAAVRRFVESLEKADGGFRAGAWDAAADVEYTFYGLGTLSLLAHVH